MTVTIENKMIFGQIISINMTVSQNSSLRSQSHLHILVTDKVLLKRKNDLLTNLRENPTICRHLICARDSTGGK